MKDEYSKNIPKEANKVLIYYYSYLKKNPYSREFINHRKFLALYLNEKDILVKIAFSEI